MEEFSAPTDNATPSWSDEVIAHDNVIPAASALPTSNSWGAAPNSPPHMPKADLVEQLVKAHGKASTSTNDVCQHKNSEYRGPRPESCASVKATTPAKPKHSSGPFSTVKIGATYVSQSSATKTHAQALEVIVGDRIAVFTHVYGIIYKGRNLRTGLLGHFRDSIFKRNADENLISHQQEIAKKIAAVTHHARAPCVSTTVSKKLDRFENTNAAEWDVVPVTRSRTVASAPTRPSVGFSSSRFAVLDMDSKSESSEQQDVQQGMSREEISRMVDEKVLISQFLRCIY